MNKLKTVFSAVVFLFATFAFCEQVPYLRIKSITELASKMNNLTGGSRKAAGGIAAATTALMFLPELSQLDLQRPVSVFFHPEKGMAFEGEPGPGIKMTRFPSQGRTLYPYQMRKNSVIFASDEFYARSINACRLPDFKNDELIYFYVKPDKQIIDFLSGLAVQRNSRRMIISTALESVQSLQGDFSVSKQNKARLKIVFVPRKGTAFGTALNSSFERPSSQVFVLRRAVLFSAVMFPADKILRKNVTDFIIGNMFPGRENVIAKTVQTLLDSTAGTIFASTDGIAEMIHLPLKKGTATRLERLFADQMFPREVGGIWTLRFSRRLTMKVRFEGDNVLVCIPHQRRMNQFRFPAVKTLPFTANGKTVYTTCSIEGEKVTPLIKLTAEPGHFLFVLEADSSLPKLLIP